VKSIKAQRKAVPEPETKLGEVLEFMRLLWAIDHGLQTTSKRMRSNLGVTGPQRLVVRIIGRVPGISAGGIARILHVHPSTLTGVLRRLERDGAIDRKGDPGDARRALFSLTSHGREVDSVRGGTVEASVRTALSKASDRELEMTRKVLRLLAAELEDAGLPTRRGRTGSEG
jgi:DNA-binding MarR family transcriptional regulator